MAACLLMRLCLVGSEGQREGPSPSWSVARYHCPFHLLTLALGESLSLSALFQTEEFEACQSVLSAMGKNIVHCGGVGTGQVCCDTDDGDDGSDETIDRLSGGQDV